MSTIRLDKYLADAGIGTRSQIKAYIRKGLVSVNFDNNVKPEQKVTTNKDIISFNNKVIEFSEYEYYILNKPAGYVSAKKDNLYPTVISLIDSNRKDLFPVGRLDKDTEGLLLITNDGDLSHRLLSPRHHVDKIYYAVLDSPVTDHEIELFASGIVIGDDDLDTTMPAKLEILSDPLEFVSSYYNKILEQFSENTDNQCGYVMITINEGKYHQIKRMFQSVNRKVLYLRRLSMGNMTLPPDLAPGEYRLLDNSSIALR